MKTNRRGLRGSNIHRNESFTNDLEDIKMKADYKNWVPNGMTAGLAAATAVFAAGAVVAAKAPVKPATKQVLTGVLSLGAVGFGVSAVWCVYAHNRFSYEGKRKLSKQIIDGVADYITLPDGGVCLDVGCGSGALGIQVALRNPQGRVVGIDRWGAEYASFNQERCEANAKAEGAENITFRKGDANHLEFPDGCFDAVTSNYVYHNISGVDKQILLRETLRVLKKGGTFAIHDLMGKARYGDMEQFVKELRAEGYEDVRMISTANGMFMDQTESRLMFLSDSTLLVGRK